MVQIKKVSHIFVNLLQEIIQDWHVKYNLFDLWDITLFKFTFRLV